MRLSSHKKFIHFLVALPVIAVQAAVLNYFLATLNEGEGSLLYLSWIAGDVVVLAVFIATYILGERGNNNYAPPPQTFDQKLHRIQTGPVRHLGILPHAWVGWLVYSLVLTGKIVCMFKTYGPNLKEEHIPFINILEFTLGSSALVFILLVGGVGSLATQAQQHYLRWMQHYVLLELIDCIEFLTLLFVNAELGPDKERPPVELADAILSFACINLISPAHALYWLSSSGNHHAETRNRFFLNQTLVGTLFGNIPYLIVRVYLWRQYSFVTGLFMLKNVIGIMQDAKELLEYVQEERHPKSVVNEKKLEVEATELNKFVQE